MPLPLLALGYGRGGAYGDEMNSAVLYAYRVGGYERGVGTYSAADYASKRRCRLEVAVTYVTG